MPKKPLSEDELAGLEEEIRSARYHLEGALAMIPDPYSRGSMQQYIDQLYHSANKWLDHCVQAVNSPVPTVSHSASHAEPSKTILSGATVSES